VQLPRRISQYHLGKRRRAAVLETMSPGPFGHEHMADRAQAILWDYESYGRLPRHVKALDVGAFTSRQELFSVSKAREFFVLTEWTEGASYHEDLARLVKGSPLRMLDRRRVKALATYLAAIHRRKRRDPTLYRRRLRELIGHGECIMGLTDSYPVPFGFITKDVLSRIEEKCNQWRWRLRSKSHRLCQVHGDFHPWNVLFRTGTEFSLCRSRRLQGTFEVLFRLFWDTYLEQSRDQEVTATVAPFFAFRGLVIASPVWYPKLPIQVRRCMFRFVENVLDASRFDPALANKYCGL
jgi:hypothetical protein